MNMRFLMTITFSLSACTPLSDKHADNSVDPIPQAKIECLLSGGKENENCIIDTVSNPSSL